MVEGKAKITHGRKEYILNVNESDYIPLGDIHRLENPTDTILKIVEVQSGKYLGEDDIERLDDDFGR